MVDNVPLIQNPNDVQQINASIIALKKASKELDEKIARFNKLLSQEITDAIDSLDVAGVGGSGKYISAISETDGKVEAVVSDIANVVWGNNNNPVSSSAVAEILSSLPTDAVLHYSFDEVPDYPDGTADVRRVNGDTYSVGMAEKVASVGTVTTDSFTQDGKIHKSSVNGNANYKTDTSSSLGTGIYFALNNYQGKVVIIDFFAETTNLDIKIYYRQSATNNRTIIYPLGTSVALGKHRIMLSVPANCVEYSLTFYSNNTVPNYTEWELMGYYVGDGSYTTPIIDNANGQNNGTNNGGIAVQGVSGKGAYFPESKYAQCNFNLAPNFTISIWVNPSDNVSGKSRNIVHKTNQLILQNGAGFGDYLQVYLYGDSSTLLNGADFGALLPPNVWTHVVIIRSGLEFSLYKNGVKIRTIALADNTLRQNTEKFKVANEVNTGSQSVDDLLIFDRALSETEVTALYLNRGNTPKYYSWADWKLRQM